MIHGMVVFCVSILRRLWLGTLRACGILGRKIRFGLRRSFLVGFSGACWSFRLIIHINPVITLFIHVKQGI